MFLLRSLACLGIIFTRNGDKTRAPGLTKFSQSKIFYFIIFFKNSVVFKSPLQLIVKYLTITI